MIYTFFHASAKLHRMSVVLKLFTHTFTLMLANNAFASIVSLRSNITLQRDRKMMETQTDTKRTRSQVLEKKKHYILSFSQPQWHSHSHSFMFCAYIEITKAYKTTSKDAIRKEDTFLKATARVSLSTACRAGNHGQKHPCNCCFLFCWELNVIVKCTVQSSWC